MDEIFTLHWNEYQSNLNLSFKRLRNDTSYKDVTLVADDQKIVTAHKLILSMCSGYFQNVLSKYNHENPMICLDGISSNELTLMERGSWMLLESGGGAESARTF